MEEVHTYEEASPDAEANVTFQAPAPVDQTVTRTDFSATLAVGDKKIDLTEDGEGAEGTVSWAAVMTIHIDADFAEGKDKTIEISLPQGMTFSRDGDGDQVKRYLTSDLSKYLKEKIVSTDQSDDSKKSQVILEQQQYNGTMTLKFFSQGDDNDVSQVSFDVIVCPAYSGISPYGTAWFYDKVNDPVTVTQYMDGKQISQKHVKSLTIINDEEKKYGTSWTPKYNPQVKPGAQTTGDEYFYVEPIPGIVCKTAYRYFSITYFVPEHAEFVGFNPNGGSYLGTQAVVTTRSDTNTKTAWSDEIPEGYKALTWEFHDRIADPKDLKVAPIFRFPAEYFHSGDKATISVGAVHVRYYDGHMRRVRKSRLIHQNTRH